MIRPLAISDMPLLNRYRNRGLFLDSTPTLTWGRAIVPAGALLSPFSSLTGVFTSILDEPEMESLIGQIVHNQGSPFAHFTFLSPGDQLQSRNLSELLDHLIARVGARGAHSLIAEVDEEAPAFAALREAGFSVYARQRIWRMSKFDRDLPESTSWKVAAPSDSLSVNLLCGSLVPGLIQQVEPTPWDGLSGKALYAEGELRAYVDLSSGPSGIWIQPFVHHDARNMGENFATLFSQLRPQLNRPVFICVRSYQEWLEPMLHEIGAEQGPLQAVMVKRTTGKVKVKERTAIIEREARQTEPTTPIQLPQSRALLDLELIKHD